MSEGYEPIGTLEAIPGWARLVNCFECDEPIIGGQGSVWHGGDPLDHRRHTDCEGAAEYARNLGTIDNLRHQALVEAVQTLNRFVCYAEEENWNDEVAQTVFSVIATLDRGLAADYTARNGPQHPSGTGEEGQR